MELIASGHQGGFRDDTSVDSSTDRTVDLSEFEDRYVAIWFDQAAYIGFSDVSSSGTPAPTLVNTGDVTATVDESAEAARVSVGERVPAETYVTKYIRRPNVFLVYKAQSTSITALEVVPTSTEHKF